MFKESGKRSFVKMLSWRVWATLTTMILVYIFVGKIEVALTVGVLEVIAKMILYYVHERFWDRIKRGRLAQKPFVVWFTGLPCSGKTTLADKVYEDLKKKGYRVERLDGDTVRSIFPKIGFSKEERNAHIQKIGFLSSMLEKNGVIVISSFVSPYRAARKYVEKSCNTFVEVYVDTSVEECERRDVKGMYKKARNGEIKNFTGVDDPYEVPENPDVEIKTEELTEEESVEKIEKYLKKHLIG